MEKSSVLMQSSSSAYTFHFTSLYCTLLHLSDAPALSAAIAWTSPLIFDVVVKRLNCRAAINATELLARKRQDTGEEGH